MDTKQAKIEVIVSLLKTIYKNHNIPYYPQTLEWTAELTLEKLEEVDIIAMERWHNIENGATPSEAFL